MGTYRQIIFVFGSTTYHGFYCDISTKSREIHYIENCIVGCIRNRSLCRGLGSGAMARYALIKQTYLSQIRSLDYNYQLSQMDPRDKIVL